MLKRIKQMLGFAKSTYKADPLHAQIIVATQRNERSGEAARELIKEMLSHTDGIKGQRK